MPNQTFILYGRIADIAGQISPFSDGNEATAMPRLSTLQAPSLFSIFNRAGSNRKVKIHSIGLDDQANYDSAVGGTVGTYELGRISGCTGGVLVTPIAYDSSAPAIPSQVLTTKLTGSVSGFSALRKGKSRRTSGESTLPMQNHVSSGGAMHKFDMQAWICHYDAQTESITLREGEGIALHYPTGTDNGSLDQINEVEFIFAIGTDVYMHRFSVHPVVGMSLGCIFNGAGSGVVIKVLRVSTHQNVSSPTATNADYQLQTISDAIGGQLVPAIPTDSSSALPDSVEIRHGAVSLLDYPDNLFAAPGKKTGEFKLGKLTNFTVSMTSGSNFLLNSLARGYCKGMLFRDDMHHAKSRNAFTQSITLNEGEGVAVINRVGYTGHWDMIIRAVISIEDTRYWTVTETFKNSSGVNLPDGTEVGVFKVSDKSLVGTGAISSGVAAIKVSTNAQVYMVPDPTATGLGGETLCTTAITPT